MSALVREECRIYDPRIMEKEIELVTSIAADATLPAADPMRLAQIVGNLLDNAIKYTRTAARSGLTCVPKRTRSS